MTNISTSSRAEISSGNTNRTRFAWLSWREKLILEERTQPLDGCLRWNRISSIALTISNLHSSRSLSIGGIARCYETNTKCSMCVVGAGFAGLRCAEVLIEEGVQVTILEARNRIGGRVSCPQYETKRATDKR
jgi:NADPH-dependent 2,4-dienoyl-CoA reductase/sulfur reductase-like enzyme